MPVSVIDSHQHFWHPGLVDIPWLASQKASFGDPALIRGLYRPQEYLRDAGSLKVLGTVHVEPAARPEDTFTETAWLTGIADGTGLPSAIVAYANLESPDIEVALDAHARSPLLRGVRVRLNYHEPSGRRIARAADVMQGAAFRSGLRAAAKRKLVFNLSIFATQLPEAAALAQAVPEATLVLEHFGWPLSGDADAFKEWRQGMAALAACPNTAVKVSGFWAIDREWRQETIAPWVKETLALFGPERCMYGSNLPIEKLMCPMERQVEILSAILANEPAQVHNQLFVETARRVYRLP